MQRTDLDIRTAVTLRVANRNHIVEQDANMSTTALDRGELPGHQPGGVSVPRATPTGGSAELYRFR
jgi:hypothetical protein